MRLTVFSSPSRTPGVHGDDTARQFLEQFPLPKLLGDEEISAITLDAIKRLAEIPKGIDIIFPQEGQGSLQLDKVAAQSSSMLAEHPHSNIFLLKTSLLQHITDVINDSSTDPVVRSRASLISGRLLSSADAFMTIDQSCVTNLLLAIDRIFRTEESQNTDEIESTLETLGLIGSTTQGASLLFTDSSNVAKHVVELSFDRQGRGKQLALLLSVLQQDPDIRIAVDYAHYTDCISLNVCRAIEYYQDWLSENGA
ncbi:hypothetical protein ACQ4PT_043215 [Festuca glaucescens]